MLHDHAFWLSTRTISSTSSRVTGLEVQAVGGVVVGGYGFRVAVDHDGLVTIFAQGEGGVHAAVVELDTLADTVRTAAQTIMILSRSLDGAASSSS